MDETEALCSNIGIMVNGELKCLGSLQNLKAKYGKGYTLLAKVSVLSETAQAEKIKRFINFILASFRHSEVKENRDGFINMHIKTDSGITLSSIFAIMEANKKRFSVEYYVVTQTKLEQIFLNFAAMQVDAESRLVRNSVYNCCFA